VKQAEREELKSDDEDTPAFKIDEKLEKLLKEKFNQQFHDNADGLKRLCEYSDI